MIYITQGHEKGIGLEIFLKSFLMLSKKEKENVTLIADQDSLEQNLVDLKFSLNNFKELKVIYPEKSSNLPPSTASLACALEVIKGDDILITLPTSKDQLILNKKKKAGYTEYFREFYNNSNISMTFKGIDQNVLLITDHMALKDVSSSITSELIVQKTDTTIRFYKKYFFEFDEVIFAGINPHVGEEGLLGKEDSVIKEAIKRLKSMHTQKFLGPFSGDTLHVHKNIKKNQLLVYMFHDQGLAKFKAEHGFIGLNISMGLPFLRLSVDHGTAFDLYGKNIANASGMIFLLKQAFEVNKYVNKRN